MPHSDSKVGGVKLKHSKKVRKEDERGKHKSVVENDDVLETFSIDIPRNRNTGEDDDDLDLEVNDSRKGKSFDTDLENINDLIANLTSSLKVCDKKSNRANSLGDALEENPYSQDRQDRQESQACASTHEKYSREFDPLSLPESWWDSGVKYVLQWIQEIWMERMSSCAKAQLEQGNIHFFVWTEYTGKVSMDAASYSLMLMLSPWTSDDSPEDEPGPPEGLSERKEETESEVSALCCSALRVPQRFEKEAAKCCATNAPLAEILSRSAQAMRTLVSLCDKDIAKRKEYREMVRYTSVKVIHRVGIIQRYLLMCSLQRLSEGVEYYCLSAERIQEEFESPMKRMKEEKGRFKQLWEQVKARYNSFLEREGLTEKDEAAVEAMDTLCFLQDEEQEFGLESINLLRTYVEHMKRLALSSTTGRKHSSSLKKPACATKPCLKNTLKFLLTSGDNASSEGSRGGSKSSGGNNNNSNPVRELQQVHEKKKVQLDQLNREIKVLREKTVDVGEGKREEHLRKIKLLEEKRKVIAQTSESSGKLLKNYADYPLDDHNRWLDTLDKLQVHLESASTEWSKEYARKCREEVIVEEEVREYLKKLHCDTYRKYDKCIDRTLTLWSEQQTRLEKEKDESTRQIYMEKTITQKTLQSCEGKFVHYTQQCSDYVRDISEFRSVLSMLETAKDTLYRLEEFEECYEYMLQLWRVAYEISHGQDESELLLEEDTTTQTESTCSQES